MSWYTPVDGNNLTKGVKYVLVRTPTPKSMPQEYAETIKTIRSIAKNFDDKERICWERYNKPGSIYAILVPGMDEKSIMVYENLGFDVVRIYQNLSKKDRKRKRWTRIRL